MATPDSTNNIPPQSVDVAVTTTPPASTPQSTSLTSRAKRILTKNPKATVLVVISLIGFGLVTDYTLGGFTATIVNPTNSFASGSLQLEETSGSATCYSNAANASGAQPVTDASSFNCTVIDHFGAAKDVVPGTPSSTTVTMVNLGGKDASAESLVADPACHVTPATDNAAQQGSNANYCSMVDLTIENTTSGATDKCLYPVVSTSPCDITASTNAGNLTAVQGATIPGLTLLDSSATPATYKFTVMVDPTATSSDMGLTATLGFTWTQN
jgi:hypothetical protein